MWTRPHVTNEVMPLDIQGPDGAVTDYDVAITEHDEPPPTSGYTPAETDGDITGPRINGLDAGMYLAYPKIGTRVLNPVPFYLT